MRQSLFSAQSGADSERSPLPLVKLPGWCCEAAGGDPDEAEPVAAAWILLYASAHLFDAVQDGDPPDAWWRDLDAGVPLNAACGLLASAWSVLLRIDRRWAAPVRRDFADTVLQMASGQHADLSGGPPSLDRAWEIAAAKSGAFFALAARSGARIGGAAGKSLKYFAEFGANLGLMIQIADDAADLQSPFSVLARSGLPIAYARATAPASLRLDLAQMIEAQYDQRDLHDLLDHNGTKLYLTAKLAQFRARGIRALHAAEARPPARDRLCKLLLSLDPSA